MPDNKEQHFVPRFYLKKFASDSHGKAINIAILKNSKIILNGKLKNQCYKDYYYGKTGEFEKALKYIEDEMAAILRDLEQNYKLPNKFTEWHYVLLTYVLLQIARTENAEEEMNYNLDQLTKTIFAPQLRAKGLLDKFGLDDFKIKWKEPMQLSIAHMYMCIPLCIDLDYKVLLNNTRTPFITSDNPAVKYNQFLEPNRRYSSNRGLGVKGFQIFFPVSPKMCLVFFDSKTYRAGNRKDSIVPITDTESVKQINGLQVVNCLKTIYFNKGCSNAYISDLLNSFIPFRRKEFSILSKYESAESDKKSILVHAMGQGIRINLRVNGIKELKQSKQFIVDEYLPFRDKELLKIHREFITKVGQREYLPSDFHKFLAEKNGNFL